MELEVLTDERGNIEETVIVTLSVSEVDFKAGLVCGFKEVINKKLLLFGEFVIRAEVN